MKVNESFTLQFEPVKKKSISRSLKCDSNLSPLTFYHWDRCSFMGSNPSLTLIKKVYMQNLVLGKGWGNWTAEDAQIPTKIMHIKLIDLTLHVNTVLHETLSTTTDCLCHLPRFQQGCLHLMLFTTVGGNEGGGRSDWMMPVRVRESFSQG